MPTYAIYLILALLALAAVGITIVIAKMRHRKKYERGLKMVPILIHLPPMTDDVGGSESGKSGRDQRDIANEAISKAQVMYSILASTVQKGLKAKIYGQRHFSLEIIARDGYIRYYAVVPAVLTETVCQAIQSAYPTARVEEKREENIFKNGGGLSAVAGAELSLTKEGYYPIATYEDTKRDGQMALLNALSDVKAGEGAGVQILFRPAKKNWSEKAKRYMDNVQRGKNTHGVAGALGDLALDVIRAPWEPPEAHDKDKDPVTNVKQAEIEAINNKIRYPAFETLIRIVASSDNASRSDAIVGGIVSAFAQYNTPEFNSFKVDLFQNSKQLVIDYTFRFFNVRNKSNILNSVELATIYHLPEQNAIPNSQVERQLAKQVDGPTKIPENGLLLGTNEFRGVKKPIYLAENDRRRHMYVIGQTGMGKSVFLENLAFQDMCDGKGFAFIDPHGDAVEALLKRVPEERIDDVIYFNPADIEHPIGMNMFEFTDPDQKDFIVQEGIAMLQSLFDPNNQGFFGARGQHMFRNAALLLMSDPHGATFIDIPQCFTDPEFVKSKLKYVTDKAVYDYWTKEFPESKKSNDSGEVTTWFASKWGPFIANTIMRNTLGQVKSGFNIREIMDNHKIFLVNLSKGQLGDVNANLLGMIFVMKFQQAAMSRQDIPEKERQDFCLYVDEFQNFATDSFESILSEARKYRLNLIVANQFMTQLTDKIREALLGNVGTIVCGRVGVTDAELMVKAFTPVFTAEDLTKTPNYAAVAKVMMFDMPSSPFTISLPPPMGEPSDELMESLKAYSATKYGRPRAEVEKEISDRWNATSREKQAASNRAGASGSPSANSGIPTGSSLGAPVASSSSGIPGLSPSGLSGSSSPSIGSPDASSPHGASIKVFDPPSRTRRKSSTAYDPFGDVDDIPKTPSKPSRGASGAFSGDNSANAYSGASDAPTGSSRPHKGFLDDWLASVPTTSASAPTASTSTSTAPTPVSSAPPSTPTPAPKSAPNVSTSKSVSSTPNSSATLAPKLTHDATPASKPTPVSEPTPTPPPISPPADEDDEDDTDSAPPSPQSDGISLQIPVPEPDSTPEDEIVFRVR